MSNVMIFSIIGAVFFILIIIEAISGSKHPFRKAFLNSLLGIVSLISVNIASLVTGISLPISILSLSVSSLAGLPGVAMMIIINTIINT